MHGDSAEFRVPLPSTWLAVFRQVTSYPTNFQNKQKLKTRGVVIRWDSRGAWELNCVLPLVLPKGCRAWWGWKVGVLIALCMIFS